MENKSNENDTLSIIKEKKVIIGLILIVTLIVICGIILTGDSNDSNISLNDVSKYSANGFTFNYPKEWSIINESDVEHPGAIFYQNKANVTIEFYNVTTQATSLKQITNDILNYAQNNGAYVELVEPVTLDGRNSSNIIIGNANGSYTRYVSMFSNNELYVFKITGNSIDSLNSDDINSTINTANIA